MDNSAIYTTEPMATRALAAEIRHSPHTFVRLLERVAEADTFGILKRVNCEGDALIDVQLDFENPHHYKVGIEAKVDHELSKEQLEKELRAVDVLFLLLPLAELAPSWLPERVKVITWKEVLGCFSDSRLTMFDIESMPLQKSRMALRFERLREEVLLPKLGPGWVVEVKRLNGKPACWFESPQLPNGRKLSGDIQIHGLGMPNDLSTARFKYFIAVSVTNEDDFPDTDKSESVPGWINHLRTLQNEVLEGNMDRYFVSQSKPKSGRSAEGTTKMRLAKKHLREHLYLAQGYVPWALGIRSIQKSHEQLDELTDIAAEIITRWYHAERMH